MSLGTESAGLSSLLERVAALQEAKAEAEAEAKSIGRELAEVERLAVEQLALSGLDGVRAAGKSWSLRESYHVNVSVANRDAVLAAAKKQCPEIVAVNTSSLKAWLVEERERSGATGESLADGTPFAGLVSEYREVKLSSRKVG